MLRFTQRFPALFNNPVGFLMMGWDGSIPLVREVSEIHAYTGEVGLSTIEEAIAVNPRSLPFQCFYGLFTRWTPGGNHRPSVFVERLVSGRVSGRWYGYDNMLDPDIKEMDPHYALVPLFTEFELPCLTSRHHPHR